MSDAVEARRLVETCPEAGFNLFDAADVCSEGAPKKVIAEAIKRYREAALISLSMGDGANDASSSYRGRAVSPIRSTTLWSDRIKALVQWFGSPWVGVG